MKRRNFLVGFAVAGFAAACGATTGIFTADKAVRPFAALFKDTPMLRALSRAARGRTFAHLDRDSLTALAIGNGADAASSSPDALRSAIAAARARDIESVRMVTVDGWVLPAAEAAALALAADDRRGASV
jgi:hypothetical protein